MAYGVVYRIKNNENGKCYYGQTRQPPNRRWSQHKQAAKNGGKMILYNAMRLHGIDKFSFEVVYTCETLEELNSKEIEFIAENNSLSPDGYNASKGGDNYEKTPETCAKISASNKGRIVTEEWRKNLSNSRKGRKHSEETKKKMSTTQRGRIITAEHRDKIRNTLLGKKPSPETIAKRVATSTGKPWTEKKRNSMKGYTHTEETKAKISTAQVGRIISEETKQKMRDAKKYARKITDEQVLEIRESITYMSQTDIANKYNVSKQLICNIINHKGCYKY